MNNVQTALQTGKSVPGDRFALTKAWLKGVGVALGLVALAYLASSTLGITLGVAAAGGVSEVTFGQIFGMTLAGSSVGLAVAYIVGRWAPKPRLVFVLVTVSAAIGYGVVPFQAAATTTTAIWLNVFHLVVAIPVIATLTQALPTERG